MGQIRTGPDWDGTQIGGSDLGSAKNHSSQISGQISAASDSGCSQIASGAHPRAQMRNTDLLDPIPHKRCAHCPAAEPRLICIRMNDSPGNIYSRNSPSGIPSGQLGNQRAFSWKDQLSISRFPFCSCSIASSESRACSNTVHHK